MQKSLPLLAFALALLQLAVPGYADNTPVRVIEDSLLVPEGLDTEEALASVGDISQIFALYEPVIPKLPGVQLDLKKSVVQASSPTILELPVSGSAIGYRIDERARVTAQSEETSCSASVKGRKITLDFHASTYNIERRIDRIEITACPSVDEGGHARIDAVGRMYSGYLLEDPKLNAFSEAIAAKALQGAFIRQVPAVFSAVERHWATMKR